jgi:hypothetical protein
MNTKTLVGLVIVALVALVAAVLIQRSHAPRSEVAAQAQRLVPALRDHVNDVDRLVLTGAENKTIATLERGKDGWTVAERHGFPADVGKLRDFLLKVADATLVEEKTANPERYAELGVEDVSAKDAKGVQVEIGGLVEPVKLIVGNPNARGGGMFVRRDGEARSWLASGSFAPDKTITGWLRRDIADIGGNRIDDVTITHPDGRIVHLYKKDAGDSAFTLADVPKGREAAAEYTLGGPASLLSALRLDDVAPADDAKSADDALKVRLVRADGLVADVVAWKKGDKHYAQFTASKDAAVADHHVVDEQARAKADYDAKVAGAGKSDAAESADAAKKDDGADGAAKGDVAESADKPAPPLAVADPVKDREMREQALDKEVVDLNARFRGWTFTIPPSKYAAIDKSLDDLLNPLDESRPAATPVKGGAKPPVRAARPPAPPHGK